MKAAGLLLFMVLVIYDARSFILGTLMNTRALIFGAALAFPAPAYAYFISGNKLYEYCSSSTAPIDEAVKFSSCIGYVQASSDYLTLTEQIRSKPRCYPGDVTTRQLMDIVMKYMNDHPEDRSMPAVMVINLAIATAWPTCADDIQLK